MEDRRPASARGAARGAARQPNEERVRPLSARLAGHGVEPPELGLAEVLASACRDQNGLPGEFKCPEAAVLRLAPGGRLRPCRSVSCCWRWAACELLDECLAAAKGAAEMRKVLEEELGDSILEKLLGLEAEHQALQRRLQELRQELQREQSCRRSLEDQLVQMQKQVDEAELRALRSAQLAERSQAAQERAEDAARELAEELERQAKNSPEELRRSEPERAFGLG
ncbi:unnamed protein product, partial [Effrenium voratum]